MTDSGFSLQPTPAVKLCPECKIRSPRPGKGARCHTCAKKRSARRNPEKAREAKLRQRKRYRERHYKEISAYFKQRRDSMDPLERRLKSAVSFIRQRQKVFGGTGSLTWTQLRDRLAYFGWKCWMCGAPWEQIDHVIPRAKGGTDWPSNLRPACRSCNVSRRWSRWGVQDGGGLL